MMANNMEKMNEDVTESSSTSSKLTVKNYTDCHSTSEVLDSGMPKMYSKSISG